MNSLWRQVCIAIGKAKSPSITPSGTVGAAVCVLSSLVFANAQSNIPIGTWRSHISYNEIIGLAVADNNVFGAAENGVMILDRSDNSISTYTKLNGLSGTTITSINYNQIAKALVIGYADGRFDIIDSEDVIESFNPAGQTGLTGSKKINNIYINEDDAYLSTDYGVIVFDLTQMQIKETWRDLGVQGETLPIKQCTLNNDSIFLATANGVLTADFRSNLLDFNNWTRFNTGEFNGAVQDIVPFNGSVYAAIDNAGIYRCQNGEWIKQAFLSDDSFRSMHASPSKLRITTTTKIWELSATGELVEIVSPLVVEPRCSLSDEQDVLWIGDGRNGIVSLANGSVANYLPDSPSNKRVRRLKYQGGVMYALGGGYTDNGLALGNRGNIDLLTQGDWSTEISMLTDLTDIATDNTTKSMFSSSFGFGLEERKKGGEVGIFNETNSPLESANGQPGFVNITSLAVSRDGLWVANYGVENPLHLLKPDAVWESFSFPITASRYPLQVETDRSGSVWMALDPRQGGGILVFNREKNARAYLTDTPGSGGLPARSVHTLAVDRDGQVWVGTDQGVAFFINPSAVFSGTVDAIKPIYESRFLLRDDKITTIAVDGGNRKWIGTERGVWLFNASGDVQIFHFTAENSPLLSNLILDISIDDVSGEVFFATNAGLVSFRSDASGSDFFFRVVKVFPNPVTSNFTGTVGISGLATDAIVKITDIGGKLIWQTQANGGTATWNVQDHRGRRVATGIYLVFATTADGGESVVAKVAVVD